MGDNVKAMTLNMNERYFVLAFLVVRYIYVCFKKLSSGILIKKHYSV